jgi:hypothetical protein
LEAYVVAAETEAKVGAGLTEVEGQWECAPDYRVVHDADMVRDRDETSLALRCILATFEEFKEARKTTDFCGVESVEEATT